MLARTTLVGLVLAAAACRPGEGERCFCEGECRQGFACAADGAILRPGQCVDQVSQNIEAGACVDAENLGDEGGSDFADPYFDLGTGWLTDPAPTTTPPTSGPMTMTDGSSTTATETSSDTSGSSSSGTDTDAVTSTGSESGSSTAGTAGGTAL